MTLVPLLMYLLKQSLLFLFYIGRIAELGNWEEKLEQD
jgi:hypothetical protein